MEQVITCINCPIGCRMTVNVENGEVVSVTGNSCKRGLEYAAQESVAPKRMVTAVVAVAGRKTPVSVKTRTPIPKAEIFACMRAIEALRLRRPSAWGTWCARRHATRGVDVIATKNGGVAEKNATDAQEGLCG
jgi:CxxC motif-containing protein